MEILKTTKMMIPTKGDGIDEKAFTEQQRKNEELLRAEIEKVREEEDNGLVLGYEETKEFIPKEVRKMSPERAAKLAKRVKVFLKRGGLFTDEEAA